VANFNNPQVKVKKCLMMLNATVLERIDWFKEDSEYCLLMAVPNDTLCI